MSKELTKRVDELVARVVKLETAMAKHDPRHEPVHQPKHEPVHQPKAHEPVHVDEGDTDPDDVDTDAASPKAKRSKHK